MKIRKLGLLGVSVLALAAVLPLSAAAGGAQHVRWDIISFTGTAPLTFNPGGFAEAKAPPNTGNHNVPANDSRISLTGSGTFVAPAGGNGGSNAVTGGGTWQTFSSASSGGALTGSGTYVVKELVTFEFAGFQTGTFIDNIGDTNERANGTAVLRIEYNDGTRGVLMVGCHGPGAPDGIVEGIAVTKGFTTYDLVQTPVGGVDANRTLFHVR
ncbi:MAG: hypothetical protein WEE67_06065 [Chloroflexota bacterium]